MAAQKKPCTGDCTRRGLGVYYSKSGPNSSHCRPSKHPSTLAGQAHSQGWGAGAWGQPRLAVLGYKTSA